MSKKLDKALELWADPPTTLVRELLRKIYNTYNLNLDQLNRVVRVADKIWQGGSYSDALSKAVDLCVNVEYNHASLFKGANHGE